MVPSDVNPIRDTFGSIPGYPATLKIYKIPASKFWQVRVWWETRMVCRSTKTEIRSEAINFAKQFYNDLLLKRAKHEPVVQSNTFETVAGSLIAEDQSRVERGERSESLVSDAKHIIYKDLVPFFKSDSLKKINYARITAYMAHAKAIRGERQLSSNTMKNHFIFLRKVLKHGQKMGLLDSMPVFPTISTEDAPREWFSEAQYKFLRETIVVSYGETAKKTYKPIDKELLLLTIFMVNSFLRPPDMKNLRNRDIEVVGDEYLRIRAASKVKASPVITMPLAVEVYEQLRAHHPGLDGPDDFVFFPDMKDRGYAFQTWRLQFNHVLVKAGLKNTDGVPRTLYSLRHTSIMLRLTKGENVDLLTLARNCRTSIEMLERFYASHLTPEMNVGKLTGIKAKK